LPSIPSSSSSSSSPLPSCCCCASLLLLLCILLLLALQDDATAETLLNRIEAGELTFAEAAAKFSSCPSRGKRGELGAFPGLGKILFLPYEGQEVAEFDALVFSPDTELNKLYKVRTQFGTHLVTVAGRA